MMANTDRNSIMNALAMDGIANMRNTLGVNNPYNSINNISPLGAIARQHEVLTSELNRRTRPEPVERSVDFPKMGQGETARLEWLINVAEWMGDPEISYHARNARSELFDLTHDRKRLRSSLWGRVCKLIEAI